MNIEIGYPPNYEKIKSRLTVEKNKKIVFTYGDTLYNPSNGFVSKDLEVHEKTHIKQQAMSTPDKWWEFYLTEDLFRLDQEVEAYRNQYRYFKQNSVIKDRIPQLLERLAHDLSSPVYGNIITFEGALELIRG